MTNTEIEAFWAVVQTGSITRAAESLYVTQPALSRTLKALESELGYQLLTRQRGNRSIELTDAGRAFVSVAEKWQALWKEARDISRLDRELVLNIVATDSINSCIMPSIYDAFLRENPRMSMSISTRFSYEGYDFVEQGLADMALITCDRYSKNIETIPAFKEKMCFVCNKGHNCSDPIAPSRLDPAQEIRVPWNPEYDMWHNYWFDSSVSPRVRVDKFSLTERFLAQLDSWAIVPASVAGLLTLNPKIERRELRSGPPDRICYYLLGKSRKPEATRKFLSVLDQYIRQCKDACSLLI